MNTIESSSSFFLKSIDHLIAILEKRQQENIAEEQSIVIRAGSHTSTPRPFEFPLPKCTKSLAGILPPKMSSSLDLSSQDNLYFIFIT
jgi:hypothetical protein